MSDPAKTPLDLFNEAHKRAMDKLNTLKVDEFFWHSLIEARTDMHQAFQQIQFIYPTDKVKLHDKIAELQLWALKVG